MSIRSILVHLDATSRSSVRLDFARQLALEFDAGVSALYAMTPYSLTVPALYTAEAILMLEGVDEEWRAKSRQDFDARCGIDDACEVSWSESTGPSPIESVVQQSRYADLVVLGQRDPQDPITSAVPVDFVTSVLMQGGRPAIVLPYAGSVKARPERVVVAWNGSAESARAVTAALPLLRLAREVRVLQWGEEDIAARGAVRGIGDYLLSHGVQARVQRYDESDVDVGNTLVNAMSDFSAELLVMGCYGHSRAREWIMGGATRTVLQSMTVPVLMSH